MKGKKAKLYIDGKIVIGDLLFTDTKTYITPFHVFYLESMDKKVAVFENGDKFREWI